MLEYCSDPQLLSLHAISSIAEYVGRQAVKSVLQIQRALRILRLFPNPGDLPLKRTGEPVPQLARELELPPIRLEMY